MWREEERGVTVWKSLARLREVESQLLTIDENEVRARKAYAALGEGGGRDSLTSAQFWVIDAFIQGQKVRRVETKRELERRDEAVRGDYSDYVKAKQNLKVIETLREKDFARYRKELQRYEMKQLDDVYTMRDRLSVNRARKGNNSDAE